MFTMMMMMTFVPFNILSIADAKSAKILKWIELRSSSHEGQFTETTGQQPFNSSWNAAYVIRTFCVLFNFSLIVFPLQIFWIKFSVHFSYIPCCLLHLPSFVHSGICTGLGQSTWDLWWTKWHWDRSFSEFFGFPLSVSFHHGSPCSYITWRMNNRRVGGHSSET
jgi:hypothetical protein